MQLTKEQEERLLIQYDPFIRACVNDFTRKMRTSGIDNREDFLQEARIAFLRHLRRMHDLSQITVCGYFLKDAMCDYCRRIAPVHIPRRIFSKELRKVHQISWNADEAENILPLVSDAHIVDEAEYRCFMEGLTEEERTIIEMKQAGSTNREIMPVIRARNEPQMSRIVQRLRQKVLAFIYDM